MSWLEANPLWALALALACFIGMPLLRALIEGWAGIDRRREREIDRPAPHVVDDPWDRPPPAPRASAEPPTVAAVPKPAVRAIVDRKTLPIHQPEVEPGTPGARKGKRRRRRKASSQHVLPGMD